MSGQERVRAHAQKNKKAAFCVVAVTGRSGSGKSTVTAHFAALGYPALDADAVARDIAQTGSPCLAQLAQAFGADILDENGALRRAVLAARAFETPEMTKRLTEITHPAMMTQLLDGVATAKKSGAPLIFVDGAVIVGGMFEQYCDIIVVVTAPEKDAISRIVLRDGISKQAAHQRLAAQMAESDLRAAADYVLENNGTQASLLRQADAVLTKLTSQGEL